MLKYLNTKNKHKLFFHLRHKWAWPKQLAKKFSATLGIFSSLLEVRSRGFCYARKKFYARSVHLEPAPGEQFYSSTTE